MKGTNIGELEELVLLSVALLFDDAYGIAVMQEIKERSKRHISISSIHAVLNRLEKKGYLSSRYDGAIPERGGRRKHLYRVTKSGQKVLAHVRDIRNEMWGSIPKMAFDA